MYRPPCADIGCAHPEHRGASHYPDNLHVITCVSNPLQYESRRRLTAEFQEQCRRAGVTLWTIEAALGERPFEHTRHDDPHHRRVRVRHEFWHKETLLNRLVASLPSDWRYVAWVDADILFADPNWAERTVQALQHYRIVQMFSEAHDLGPDGMTVPGSAVRSFAWSHVHGVARPRPTALGLSEGGFYSGECKGPDPRIAYWHHPGYAWAIRRSAYDDMGGFFDVAVVGEADFLMAKGVVNEAMEVVYPGAHPNYLRAVGIWQERAQALRADLGYVRGTVLHNWHGRKADRQYWTRKRVLVDHQFDPTTDLARDAQGIWGLADDGSDRFVRLRDALRGYFRARNEDSTEL